MVLYVILAGCRSRAKFIILDGLPAGTETSCALYAIFKEKGTKLRNIGIPEIEDIALGAALLGAGGGGDPYVGKLVAMGAVQECGPVTLLDPEEVPDDALIVPIAMMGAPTVLCEKGIGGEEYQTLYDTVSQFYGKPIYAFMPIEAGGVNSMLPIAAAARLGLPLVDCDGMGRAFPELQMVTFTIGGVQRHPHGADR